MEAEGEEQSEYVWAAKGDFFPGTGHCRADFGGRLKFKNTQDHGPGSLRFWPRGTSSITILFGLSGRAKPSLPHNRAKSPRMKTLLLSEYTCLFISTF